MYVRVYWELNPGDSIIYNEYCIYKQLSQFFMMTQHKKVLFERLMQSVRVFTTLEINWNSESLLDISWMVPPGNFFYEARSCRHCTVMLSNIYKILLWYNLIILFGVGRN